MDGYIGEIRMFAPDYAPQNWAFCHGQILGISQNQVLFAILGTSFGGNGFTTFALPDMRGRTAIGVNDDPQSYYPLGQKTGNASTVLTGDQLPAHNHTISGSISMLTTNQPADAASPAGNYFAIDGSPRFDSQHDGVTMKPANVNLNAGNINNNPYLNNMMPYLGIHYIICLTGIFPPRT